MNVGAKTMCKPSNLVKLVARILRRSFLALAVIGMVSIAAEMLDHGHTGNDNVGEWDLGVWVSEAEAFYGGTRRRTRRRTAVVAGSAGYSAGASSEPAAPAQSEPATPQPGTAVPALPGGCGPMDNGVHNCGGVLYKPFYEGNNVVYVVVDRP